MALTTGSDALLKSDGPSADHVSQRPFLIGCCVFLLILELLGVVLTRNLPASPDFRAFYAAGYLVRHNAHQLFDLGLQKQVQDTLISPGVTSLPFYHPSYEALLFAPLSLLSFRAAYLVSIGLNVLLLGLILRLSSPLFARALPFLQPRPGFIFFLFAPLILAILQGQDVLLFLLVCACVWRLLESDSDTAAGIVLALGLFRLQLALPLAVLLTVRRGWRFAFSFASAAVAIGLLCLAITGLDGAKQFVHKLSDASLSGNQSAGYQDLMGIHPLAAPNLAGLLAALGTAELNAHAAFLITVTASCVVFLVAAIRMRRCNSLSAAFAVATTCSLLVSHHANPHDATILLIPIALIPPTSARYLMLALYYLPAALLLFAGPGTFFLLAPLELALLFFPLSEKKLAAAS